MVSVDGWPPSRAAFGTTGLTSLVQFCSSCRKVERNAEILCHQARKTVSGAAAWFVALGTRWCCFTPWLRFDDNQFVWLHAERLNLFCLPLARVRLSVSATLSDLRSEEPRGRFSRGCKQSVSRRLHVNQLALDAIDSHSLNEMYCGCSVDYNAGDSTKAHPAIVEMIADVARRFGRSPSSLPFIPHAILLPRMPFRELRGKVQEPTSVLGAEHASIDISILGGKLGQEPRRYTLVEAFAFFSSSGVHQGARSSSPLHRPWLDAEFSSLRQGLVVTQDGQGRTM